MKHKRRKEKGGNKKCPVQKDLQTSRLHLSLIGCIITQLIPLDLKKTNKSIVNN